MRSVAPKHTTAKYSPEQPAPPTYTTVPVAVLAATAAEKEFERLPKNGQRDGTFSLSRSTWNNLILPCKANNFRPPIKSISLRKPGAVRGCRLIVVSSAKAYFQRLLDEAEAQNNTGTEEAK